MLQHFQDFALYNRWANERIYSACAHLTDADYFLNRSAFFKSIHGTLNHLLVADRIWMARIQGQVSEIQSLNQELYETLQKLRRGRRTWDEEFIEYLQELPESDLKKNIVYKPLAGPAETTQNRLESIFTHLFNHQTHHRGQVHALLSQTPVPPPPLDYIIFCRKP